MTKDIPLEKRLQHLPPKVAVPFAQLLASGQISEDALETILDAGELAGESSRLLGFAVGYHHLRSKGVSVNDVVKMAKSLGRSINLGWSEKRWKQEHDLLARAETLIRLAGDNVAYDVSRYEALLPECFPGYVIRSSRRLGMEGLRQRHCIASYHSQLRSGHCAIAAVFVNRQRWTVQLHITGNSEAPLRLGQIRSRFNALPSEEVRKTVHGTLGVPFEPRHTREHALGRGDSHYMPVLRRILPVLQQHGVEEITVGFDGSGDSGSVDCVVCHPIEQDSVLTLEIEHPTRRRHFEDGQWFTISEEICQPIRDAIVELTDDYLEETGVDWYNNEGGFGELVINVERGTVSLEVSSRFTESVSQYSRRTDILTGEEV